MFSRRTAWDREANAWTRAFEGRRASGEPLLDLRSSNPAACGLGWNEERLRELIAGPGVGAHAPEALGLPAARESIAAWWSAHGVPAHPERTCLTASTSEAYAFLFRLLCEPGDVVAVPRPSYPLFEFLTGLEELATQPYPLRLDEGRWRLDLEQLADGLTERTRAVLVVHPNNPTGGRLSEGEARALARLCAERDLALISDEVFAEFSWTRREPDDPQGLLELAAEEGALVFALSGLSKVAGLPQLKLAWIAVDGPKALRDEALARLELIADTYLSVASPVQLAAGRLLEASEGFRERTRARILGNLGTLAASGLGTLPAGAGWSAIIELPVSVSEEPFTVELIENEGLVLHPGGFFELGPGAHVVVSLLTEPETFERGIATLAHRLGRATSA